MIMVLSTIDLLVSIIVHPLHVLNSVAEITKNARCSYKMIYQTSAVIISGMSFLTFFVMNCERFLSIVHPFFHLNYVTKRKCLLVSSVTWIVCLTTGVAPLLGLDIQNFITALVLILLFGTFYVYVCIYIEARKRRASRERSANTRTNEFDTSHCENSGARATETIHSRKTVSFLHDIQLAKMYLIVMLSSLFLNLPNAIVLSVFTDRVKILDSVVQVKIWTVTLVAMNSTMNCIIFFWANSQLSKKGWKLCKAFFRKES